MSQRAIYKPKTLVFVYGTLKYGQRNAAVMEEAEFAGDAYTNAARFLLIESPSTRTPGKLKPTVIKSLWSGHRIAGELYAVDDALLRKLDAFEQVADGLYYREKVKLNGDVEAYMYLGSRSKLRTATTPCYVTESEYGLSWNEPKWSQEAVSA